MRYALLLFLLLAVHLLAAQVPVRFEVHCSAPYATYDFLTKLSDNYPDNPLKAAFTQSKHNTPANRQLVARFEQLPLDYAYDFPQYPAPLKARLQSRDVLERNLATTQTVAGFLEKSLGLVPTADLLTLASTLDTFLPIYRELVLTPNQPALAAQQQQLQRYVDNQQFAGFLAVGLRFYGSQWDSRIPFQLNLLPSLDEQNLNARAFCNVATCETPLHLQDHQVLFSVAMHEIYHIAYDNQSLAQKEDLRRWFAATRSPNRQYALLLLNEVLATALGNGYVFEQLNGRPDPSDEWYHNPYISGMARAIYPLLKQYVAAQRPLDEAFVQAYVQTYDTRFPQWSTELPHLLAYRAIVADTPDDWRYFARSYRQYFYKRLAAPVTTATIETARESPFTKVFIFSGQHKQKLRLLAQAFPELPVKGLNYRRDFAQTFALPDGTRLLLLNRHKLTVEELITKYFPDKRIP